MALWLVLEDFAGDLSPSVNIVSAGTLLDDTVYNMPYIVSQGCPAIPYVAATMATPLANFLKQGGGVSQISTDANLLALLLAAGAIGGGSVGTPVPNRRDHSVNGARVDYFDTTQAILRTKSDAHPAGGYTGGGTGNKSILGHFLPAPMPLAALVSIEYLVEFLTPEQVPLAVNTTPYMNLVVELTPGFYVVLLFGDVANLPLSLGVYSTPGPNLFKCVWTPALPTSGVLVVNFKGILTFVPGPTANAILVGPAAQGVNPTIGVTTAAMWQTAAYTIAQILAVYPGAQIVNVYSGDGGLPKSPNITSGVLLVAGSSANTLQNAVRVVDWKLNGLNI